MKTLIGVIQSEANQYCQEEWIKNLQRLKGDYDILIVENSYDDSNFEKLKSRFKYVLKGPYLNVVKERIVVNRNIVLEWFRNHNEYDDLLFIDTDIFPPSEALELLKDCKKDIIGTACWIVGNAQTVRAAWNFFKDDVKKGNHLDFVNHLEGNVRKIYEKGKVVKIKEIGLGFTLFNGQMLRREKNIKFGSSEFILNEDFNFIRDLRKKGHDCYINLGISCFHDLRKFLLNEVK